MPYVDQNLTTQIFKWEIDTCGYGIDIDPRASRLTSSLMYGNSLFDAKGNEIARFYSPFGAAWGSGSSMMGGPPKEGTVLPLRLLMTYYDYVDGQFYELDAELPLNRIHELFSLKSVDKNIRYGTARPRFEILRVGVAPDGHIMLWAAGFVGSQIELGAYRAKVLTGITPQSYNASLDGGFKLLEDRWAALSGRRFKPETIARIKAGWRADPMHYMRDIRSKFPWKYKLTGAAAHIIELEDYRGDQQSDGYGAWEISTYVYGRYPRAIPSAAKFWFVDHEGDRHHLWISLSLRERALSEDDLTEVNAAFEKVFGKFKPEDEFRILNREDWATVEINVSDDFKRFTATLVHGEQRIPLPVARTQYFALNPGAHWPGQQTPKPEVLKLFKEGPGGPPLYPSNFM